MNDKKMLNLNLDDYKKEGLYLILPDKTRLELTRENIENVTKKYWEDLAKIPQKVKKAIDFQRCPFCPLKSHKDICDAIRPILPFLDIVDKYVSFDKVQAVYKGTERDIIHISYISIQEALKYVSILSLTNYCQIGRKYFSYYYGIIPFTSGKELACKMYLNMHWLHKADKNQINKIIFKFIEELRITSDNQVKRLSLICKNDAFMNAFVSTQVVTEFLSMDIEKSLAKAFDEFGKSAVDLAPGTRA